MRKLMVEGTTTSHFNTPIYLENGEKVHSYVIKYNVNLIICAKMIKLTLTIYYIGDIIKVDNDTMRGLYAQLQL